MEIATTPKPRTEAPASLWQSAADSNTPLITGCLRSAYSPEAVVGCVADAASISLSNGAFLKCTMLPLSYEAATRRHLSLLAASHTQCVATQCWLWPQQARMPYDANVDPLTAVVVDLDPKHH